MSQRYSYNTYPSNQPNTILIGNNNSTVTFSADAFSYLDGTPYNGNFEIFAFYLNLDDPNFYKYMPGALIGIRTNNQKEILRTFGMAAIEIEDELGNKLQLRIGKEATLTFVIPTNIQSSAPNLIPLWYFDTEIGIWREEGQATKVNNTYVGKVKHFTWWNCDSPEASVTLSFRIIDNQNNPISFTGVRITNTDNLDSRISYTDNNGRITGLVYSNANLKMEFLGNCNETIFIRNIAPLNSNVDLGDIVYNPNPLENIGYSAKLTGCDDLPLTNTYVKYYSTLSPNYPYISFLDDSGRIIFNLDYCMNATTIRYTPIDITGNNLYIEDEFTIPSSSTNSNLGTIKICNTDEEYFQYTTNTTRNYLTNVTVDNTFDSTILTLKNTLGEPVIRFSCTIFNGLNKYIVHKVNNFRQDDRGFMTDLIPSNERLAITITKMPNAPNQYYQGFIEGKYGIFDGLDVVYVETVRGVFKAH